MDAIEIECKISGAVSATSINYGVSKEYVLRDVT